MKGHQLHPLSLHFSFQLLFNFLFKGFKTPLLDHGYCCFTIYLEAGSGLCSCSTGGIDSFSRWNWAPFFMETEFHNKGGLSQFGFVWWRRSLGWVEEREDGSCYCKRHFHGGFELSLLGRFCSCVEGIMELFLLVFQLGLWF